MLKEQIFNLFNVLYQVTKIWFFWMFVHWITVQLYAYLCAHQSFMGFLTMAFLTQTPHCKALQWLFVTSKDNIIQMWIVFGTWCMTILLSPSSNSGQKSSN